MAVTSSDRMSRTSWVDRMVGLFFFLVRASAQHASASDANSF